MITNILIFLIAICGLIMIVGGVGGLVFLWNQRIPVQLRHYGMAIGMICGGFGMWGIAQALRLLLFILANAPP
jgi:hypothetical protein